MLILASTTSILKVITGSATTVDVHADYSDLTTSSGAVAGGTTNTAIVSATTTTVVAAPASGVIRNARSVRIRNKHASTSTTLEVQHDDGTTVTSLINITLLAGEVVALDDNGVWTHYDAKGAPYTYQVPAQGNLGFTGTLAETFPRHAATTNSTIGASGTLFLQAIYLTAGQVVSNITIVSGTTAAATTSNLQFSLYNSALAQVATSANQASYTWAANTVKTLAMTTPYTVPVSGLYYIGVMQQATTIATLLGGPAKLNAIIASTAPAIHGTSTTGNTTSSPANAAAITAGTASLYAAVS